MADLNKQVASVFLLFGCFSDCLAQKPTRTSNEKVRVGVSRGVSGHYLTLLPRFGARA